MVHHSRHRRAGRGGRARPVAARSRRVEPGSRGLAQRTRADPEDPRRRLGAAARRSAAAQAAHQGRGHRARPLSRERVARRRARRVGEQGPARGPRRPGEAPPDRGGHRQAAGAGRRGRRRGLREPAAASRALGRQGRGLRRKLIEGVPERTTPLRRLLALEVAQLALGGAATMEQRVDLIQVSARRRQRARHARPRRAEARRPPARPLRRLLQALLAGERLDVGPSRRRPAPRAGPARSRAAAPARHGLRRHVEGGRADRLRRARGARQEVPARGEAAGRGTRRRRSRSSRSSTTRP